MTDGDILLWISLSWLSDWERMCEQRPDDILTDYRCVDTSSVGAAMIYPSKGPHTIVDSYRDGSMGYLVVHHVVWSRFSDW